MQFIAMLEKLYESERQEGPEWGRDKWLANNLSTTARRRCNRGAYEHRAVHCPAGEAL